MKLVKYLAFSLVALLVLVMTSYMGAYYVVEHAPHMLQYAKDGQYITDHKHAVITKTQANTTITVHLKAKRLALSCYAEYVTTMSGIEDVYQFRIRRTSVIPDHPKAFAIGLILEIPKDMPLGHYRITQLVYPTCRGISLNPFDSGLDLPIDIID